MCSCVVILSLSDKITWLLQTWIIKSGNWPVVQQIVQKNDTTDWIIEEITDGGNVDTATIWKTLDVQSEELRKCEVINVKKKSGCDNKDEDIPEEVTQAKNSH